MSNDVSLDINQKSNPVQTVAPPKEDNNMLRATDKITALYCRLSVEDTKEKDGKDDPSNSIQHQQIMLMEYAKSQHFPNPTFFIDDGYSGVEFSNRPGFQKMLAEIEAGHVEVVITKDLSRLGRNSSLTGLYINYTFPQYGVRYIAINDHFDTIDPNSTDSDMAGIKNWFKNISHSGKVSNDFSLFRRFCCINRCFRCSCGKFSIVHGVQAAIGFQAVAIGEKGGLPETHPVQPRTESKRPCRSTRAKPASKELDRALSV